MLLLNALLASTFVLGKVVLGYTKPLFFVGLSMTVGGALMLSYLGLRHGRQSFRVRSHDVMLFLRVTLFTIILSYGLQFWGMQFMPAFKSCFLYNIGPFASYLIAFLLHNEKLRLKKWLGLCIGFLGLVPILLSSSPAEDGLSTLIFISLPEIAVIASAIFYAYGWFDIRELVYKRKYPPVLVNGICMLLGGLVMLAGVPMIEGAVVIRDFMPFFWLLGSTIMVEYIICNNMYAFLLHHHSETFLSFTTFLIPLFGALYSWLFLCETVTWHFFVSTVIVGIAIWFFYRAEQEEHPFKISTD